MDRKTHFLLVNVEGSGGVESTEMKYRTVPERGKLRRGAAGATKDGHHSAFCYIQHKGH